jgi:hypothetical protein
MESVRIENAKSPPIALESHLGKDLFEENFVAISLVDEHVITSPDQLLQTLDLYLLDVDQMIFPKLWPNTECIQRTALNEILPFLREVNSSASKRVNIYMMEGGVFLCGQNRGVSGSILLEDVEFDLGP